MTDPSRIPGGRDDLSEAARDLLVGDIDSVMQLELVLLLRRETSMRWTAASVALELRISQPWTADQLDVLASRGLLRAIGGDISAYTFDVDGPRAAAVEEIARRYPQWRARIVEAIFGPA